MSPSRIPLFFLVHVLLFITCAEPQTDSFFEDDSVGASSVRRPTEVKGALVAFPLNLKPHVVIRNRGQPLPDEPPPTPPNRLREERQRQTKVDQSSEAKTRRRQQQNIDTDNFQVPFILSQPHVISDDIQQHEPSTSVERFRQEAPTRRPKGTRRRPKQNLRQNAFSQLQRQKVNNFPRREQQQQQIFIAQPHPPFGEILPFDEQNPLKKPPQRTNVRRKASKHRSTTVRPARVDDFQDVNNLKIIVDRTSTPRSTFRNSSLGATRSPIRTTSAPLNNTPPPTLTRHLDEFFGDIKERILSKSITTTKAPTRTKSPLRVKSLSRTISPTITVHGDSGTARTKLKQSSQFTQSEEDFDRSLEAVKPTVFTGINPQFVEFASLTTESATTMRPTITAWKGTPKFRTILHPPPPLSLRTALSKQRVTSRLTWTPNPVKTSDVESRRRVVVSSTPQPTFLLDDSHSFEDVPRVAPRTSTVIRKIPAPTGRTVATAKVPVTKSRVRQNAINQRVKIQRVSQEEEEESEEQEEVLVTSRKTPRINKTRQDHFNAVTSSTPSVVSDKNNNPLLPRTHRVSKPWENEKIQIEEPLFHGPTVEKFRLRNRFVQRPVVRNSRKRRPFVTQSPDYLDVEPASEVDNIPTESDGQEIEPALSAPEIHPVVLTTPLQTRFVDSSIEDFVDGNSYEDDLSYEDYEQPTTTTKSTTTTRRSVYFAQQTRRPAIKSRPITQSQQRKPSWNTLTKSLTQQQKPTKPSLTSMIDYQQTKTNRPKTTEPKSDAKLGKCDPQSCQLPYCYCGGTANPGGFLPRETPQIILLTFDDAVNDLNWPLYQTLFFNDRTNPNGCPILTTLYVSHEWTDYGKVEAMYAAGHEIASHSISHGDGASYSKQKWHDEIYGQKEILSRYGGVKAKDIQGMRAPFLAIGGDKMFGMLHEDNFTYDSSVTILENNPPVWPYTLDYGFPHECAIPPCPKKSYPGLWEIPMVSLTDSNGGRCSMADSCSYSTTSDGVYEMLTSNFLRHYESNRAPLGLFYHSSWFLTPHRKEGFLRFLDEVLQQDDVYFITSMQMIEWMRNPTPLSHIKQFAPWQCRGKARQPACRISRECSISFRGDMRSFRTCGECPSIYPWVGKTNV